MIKILFCLRRRPELSPEEFYEYWVGKHAPIVQECAPLLRMRRYVQNHAFSDSRLTPSIDARGSLLEPFDGVAEIWWDCLQDVLDAGATREGRAAGRRLIEDERRFIDLQNSRLIYAKELPIALPDVLSPHVGG